MLDVSGSMKTRDIDGQSRMSAAKQAFNDVIDAVPEEVELGIRTLGADYPGEDKARGCKDTRQLYPVGPIDRTEAKTAVATLSPTGWTPIGPALLGAADDLDGDEGGSRRIVLISDGEDTCGPSTRAKWRGRSRPRASTWSSTRSAWCPTPRSASSSPASRERPAAPTPPCSTRRTSPTR
ncbi:VWA domain-containing protein [Actinomadura keratinilytica]